jgi:hypothetical protein
MDREAQPVRPPDRAGAEFDPRAFLERVAIPRLTGSDNALAVTADVRGVLASLGYAVQDQGFLFNPLFGRFALTAIGVVHAAGAFGAATFLYDGRATPAIVLLLLVLVIAAAIGLFARRLLDRTEVGRREGVNLLAVPRNGRPKYLVVAHRDSKSQPLPLSFRGPAIAFALLAWLVLLLLAIASLAQPVNARLALFTGVLGFIAGLMLVFCWVENNSPGALDNASGLTALLGIAARERHSGDVAFLVTDAEELGLEGARAIAGKLPNVIGAINLDGLDDEGIFWVVERFGWPRPRGLAPHLASALLRAADELGLEARRRDVPFGILLDHIPLVKGGTPAVSMLRGGLRSLARVHRPQDDLDHLRGDGIEPSIRLVSRALELLRAQEPAVRPAAP